MSAGVVETQFAQRLASNEKSHRDKAVRKLKKWLSARSTCTTNVMTKDELLYLWKGLFYCMWMSDKPLVQEELAQMLSDLISCFSNIDSALLFIDAFFETMEREWTGIDYLRIDKFMMLVRKFLAGCLKLVSKSQWDSNVVDGLLEVLSNTAISNEKAQSGVGLQLHVADIYVEELAKVASEEVYGKDLTKFFLPYCDLLMKCQCGPLRKTVIDRVFKFAIRLSNDEESDEEEEEETSETKGGSENANENEDCDDDDDSISSIDDETILYKGERQFRHRVRRNVKEAQMLPFPKFDYQNIGDVLLEIAGKNKSLSLKQRGEIYEVVKLFHEMAMGIFPLDTVAHSEGARLKSRDVEAAAKRLLEDDDEDARETEKWKVTLRRLSKKRKAGDDVDSMDSTSENEMDDFEVESLMKHQSSAKPEKSSNEVGTSGEDSGLIGDKFMQRLLAKQEQTPENKKPRKRKSKKIPKLINRDGNNSSSPTSITQALENTCNKVTNGNESCCIVNGESPLIKSGKSNKVGHRQPLGSVLTAKAKKRKSKQMAKLINVEGNNSSSPISNQNTSESNGKDVIGNEPFCIDSGESPLVETCIGENKQPEIVLEVKAIDKRKSRRQKKKRKSNEGSGHELKGEHSQPDSSGEAKTDISYEVHSIPEDDSLKLLRKPETCTVTNVAIDLNVTPQTDTCEPKHDAGDIKENSTPANERLINKSKDSQHIPSAVDMRPVEKSSDDHITTKKLVSSSPAHAPVEINETTDPVDDTIIEDHGKNSNLLRKTKKLSKSTMSDSNNKRGQTTRKMKETSAIATGGVSTISKAKGKKKKGGSRYFDQFLTEVDDGDRLRKKKLPAPKPNDDFVKFDTFLKSPPVFFKTAVAKMSPKTKKRTMSSTPNIDGSKFGSTKKVSFELKKNGSQDVNEYVDSVKSRPDLPFDAQNVPTQSALKLSAQKSDKSFLSFNVNQKRRATAKDFFVFD